MTNLEISLLICLGFCNVFLCLSVYRHKKDLAVENERYYEIYRKMVEARRLVRSLMGLQLPDSPLVQDINEAISAWDRGE